MGKCRRRQMRNVLCLFRVNLNCLLISESVMTEPQSATPAQLVRLFTIKCLQNNEWETLILLLLPCSFWWFLSLINIDWLTRQLIYRHGKLSACLFFHYGKNVLMCWQTNVVSVLCIMFPSRTKPSANLNWVMAETIVTPGVFPAVCKERVAQHSSWGL